MITSQSLTEKYQVRFSDGTYEAVTDAPAEYGGKGLGFKPVALLEAALSTCVTTVIWVAAEARGIPLAGVKVTASIDMSGAEETVFSYTIELEGKLTDEQRVSLMHAADGCPVKKALSKKVLFRKAETPA